MGLTWKMESSPAMNFRHQVPGNLPLEEEEHVSQKSRVLLLSEPDLQRVREDVGRPVVHPTYFYQKELELLLEPSIYRTTTSPWKNKNKHFPRKIVLLFFQIGLKLGRGRRKNGGARGMCFFSSFRRSRGRAAGEEEGLTVGLLLLLNMPGKKGRARG